MRPRTDVVALVVGLIAVAVAALGLWAAFGAVSWPAVAIAAPLALVVVGLVGLVASRGNP
ncbi:MAG: hypothetical protein Q4F65_00825 [Propionibacteriaceae bacterium]|nr:hypothetical protein [Propionibacteriaceae bacterium]